MVCCPAINLWESSSGWCLILVVGFLTPGTITRRAGLTCAVASDIGVRLLHGTPRLSINLSVRNVGIISELQFYANGYIKYVLTVTQAKGKFRR